MLPDIKPYYKAIVIKKKTKHGTGKRPKTDIYISGTE